MFHSIVVICTGNICRSPMAEGLLKAAFPARHIFSAGTAAVVGAAADTKSIAIMQSAGYDITAHRAQQVTQPMLAGVDLVLALDRTHSGWLNHRYPQFRGKVHKVMKWAGDIDVDDPYQMPMAAFEQAYREIEQGIAGWVTRL